jgi:acyl CoA:acetate/3-ketoacid CoA transferase alpha subunit
MGDSRGIDHKLLSPGEAVKKYIKSGTQVALGGFTITRNPMAIVYEIARQIIRDLHLVFLGTLMKSTTLFFMGLCDRKLLCHGLRNSMPRGRFTT